MRRRRDATRADLTEARSALVFELEAHERQGLRYDAMSVNVDRLHALTRYHHLPARSAGRRLRLRRVGRAARREHQAGVAAAGFLLRTESSVKRHRFSSRRR
jgi:hypothetical protein